MTYDILGIGLGPFNLGLAALAADIPKLSTVFIDQQASFNWHPGLLLPGARLQVPFYADLVTLANPQSRFSYFSFLHAKQRLFRFGVQDNPFPLRREYNEYGQWVAGQLPNLYFGHRCTSIHYTEQTKEYGVTVSDIKTSETKTFHAKHVVIGIGSQPFLPECARYLGHPATIHASDYGYKREQFIQMARITLVGSGQSAAEIFQDLLANGNGSQEISWFTRSPRFFPMDVSPGALEMSTPDYIDYFYQLPAAARAQVLEGQDSLYKGINGGLLRALYEQLYERALSSTDGPVQLNPNQELKQVISEGSTLQLVFEQVEAQTNFSYRTDALVLATGYRDSTPAFLTPIRDRIRWTQAGRYNPSRHYSITADDTLFVQNAERHSHGFNSADLSLGPYRNAIILNVILGYDHFALETGVAFQTFGQPEMRSSKK
jgi:lysine N6-hydroxylase